MPHYTAREQEALDSYERYVATRERCVGGEEPWSALASYFTEDAVFIDPAWGRIEGLDALVEFLDMSMSGLSGWSFPAEWTTVAGDRLVTFWWNRLEGAGTDGRPHQAPAFSILHHAGGGLFDYELDVMNMAEVVELVAASGWRPGEGYSMPEHGRDRNPTPPRLAHP